jgi:hypothetical protein
LPNEVVGEAVQEVVEEPEVAVVDLAVAVVSVVAAIATMAEVSVVAAIATMAEATADIGPIMALA